ncbi:nucleoside deaminase [Actinoplanes aureus]|uniref:nucleoside deaminase n=1 Tax=Actinoplanes aureus TaxID=2792083 RepID=UPI0035A0984C
MTAVSSRALRRYGIHIRQRHRCSWRTGARQWDFTADHVWEDRGMPDARTADELVALALGVSEEGMQAGELPVGAVVVLGEEIIGRAYTQERAQGRRLVHADLLAMEQADRHLGWKPRENPLILAITLEPCLMCLGAAMALGVSQVFYGLEAPDDGASGVAAVWQPARRSRWFPSAGVSGPVPALRGDRRERVTTPVRRKHVSPTGQPDPGVSNQSSRLHLAAAPKGYPPPGQDGVRSSADVGVRVLPQRRVPRHLQQPVGRRG